VAVDPAPAGWYPAKDGMVRYWDGTAWTDHHAAAPTGLAPGSAQGGRRGQVLGLAAVALLVCFVLGALVWGISGDFLIDDSQPVITITQSVP
jgi:hypothetical protein